MLRLLPRKAPIVYKGQGSAVELSKQLHLLGFSRVLIVTDNFLSSSGLLEDIQSTMESLEVGYEVFDEILPNPTFSAILSGENAFRSGRCEAIFAVGGGSVLDAAKMIALLHNNQGPLKNFEGVQRSRNAAAPLFAVPTTAGTGAEITPVAVVSDTETQRKVLVTDSKMIPDYISLDPVLMLGLPPAITAATGMDALTHAVEAYISRGATPTTDREAKTAVRLIYSNLLVAYRNGSDMKARDAMVTASFYAGTAFGVAGVGYVHAIAHQLGAGFGTPHGNANAMVLPEVLGAYGESVYTKLAELARMLAMGDEQATDGELARCFIESIVEMRTAMDMPTHVPELESVHVEGVARAAQKEAGSMYAVPGYLTIKDVYSLVQKLLPT